MKKRDEKPNLVVAGLLDYLSETGETRLLPEVARELEKLLKESQKAEFVVVSSFVPLSSPELKKIKEIIGRLIKTELPVINKVDKTLIGGFTIKVGDWFLDASLAAQMDYLKRVMLS